MYSTTFSCSSLASCANFSNMSCAMVVPFQFV
nr:MAG TPA: hypothetical protein [Caudoviricetes sp.]